MERCFKIVIVFFVVFRLLEAVDNDDYTNYFRRKRMIGGTNIPIEKAPYLVSLEFDEDHVCGGTIINEGWIITAAHCLKKSKSSYKIRAGSSTTLMGGSLHTIKKIVLHPKFHIDKLYRNNNDIALIAVNELLIFDKSRIPINICCYEKIPAGIFGMVAAFNAVKGRHTVRNLHYLYFKIVNKDQCGKYLENKIDIPKNQFCARSLSTGSDTCWGDSGSPFIVNNCLAGIVSWGIGCESDSGPGIYAELKEYRSWINEVIAKYDK